MEHRHIARPLPSAALDEAARAAADTPWSDQPPQRITIKRGKRQPLGLRATLGIAGLALVAQFIFLAWIGSF